MTQGKARSINLKLSALARERGVPFEKILTEFLLERMVARLVLSDELSSAFIFKGGYVGRRVYGSPRYTIDLDALLRAGNIESLKQKIERVIERGLDDGAWFKFERIEDLQMQGEYPGTRFVFRAGIGDMPLSTQRSQIVEFDIGVGDFVVSQKIALTPLIGDAAVTWEVYSREVTVAEKLHSFLSRPLANSRAKDLFDLLFLLPQCDPKTLSEAIAGTFSARSTELPSDVATAFANVRTENLKKGWRSATVELDNILSFEDAFAEAVKMLKAKLT